MSAFVFSFFKNFLLSLSLFQTRLYVNSLGWSELSIVSYLNLQSAETTSVSHPARLGCQKGSLIEKDLTATYRLVYTLAQTEDPKYKHFRAQIHLKYPNVPIFYIVFTFVR